MGRQRRAAGQDEGIERLEIGVQPVDLLLQPLDLGGDDPERFPGHCLAGVRRGEIGAEVEEVVLDAGQHRAEFGLVAGMQHGEPERRIGLVDGAETFDPEVGLGATRAGSEPRRAAVAGPGVDLHRVKL